MKTSILSVLFVLVYFLGFSQNNEFAQAMNDNLAKFESAKTQADFQSVGNQFERIAGSEKSRWEPLYFAAFSYIQMSFSEKDGAKIDQLLDNADIFIKKALSADSSESEIYTLQALSYQMRIGVNPMKRGQEYSMKANEVLEKAKALNPENPRIYFLAGQNLYHTPKFFGGGADKALPYFEKAKEKFDKFTPKNSYSPKWGQKSNENLLAECKKG
jgi:hypothetical protein